MNVAQFRGDFAEFANTATFPDTAVNRYIALSALYLDPTRWGANLDYGTELFIAHHLAVDALNASAVAVGGIPGAVKGPETSKSVDKVSISRDAGAVTNEGAGFWNLTTYGVRFWQLSNMMGSGGLQL